MPTIPAATTLLLGSALLTSAASAATTDDASSVCLNNVIQLEQRAADADLQADRRADLDRDLAEARDKAEAGDAEACRQAIRRAEAQFSGNGAAAGSAGAQPGGSPQTDAEIPADRRPDASSGMTTGSKGSPTDARGGPQNIVRTEVGALVQKAGLTQIEGTEVVGTGGETIGEVEAVAQSPDGRETFLVVGVGGLLGIGERRIAPPLADFEAGDGNFVLTGADRQTVEDMPEYDEAKLREVALPDVLQRLPDENPGGADEGPPVTR